MLETMLGEMARQAPTPDDALLQRIMADADGVIADQQPSPTKPVQSGGVFADILAALGGWTAVAGLSTAAVAGLWIGVAPPGALSDFSDLVLPSVSASALDGISPDFYRLLDEG